YFGSVDDGMRGFRTRHFLAGLYLEQQRACEAEVQLRAALSDRRSFVPAWLGLGDLFLSQGRWAGLEWAARGVAGAGTTAHGELFHDRGHLARGEFDAAKQVLEEPIARDLTAVAPRVVLSHVLLQEGKDLAGAEPVLRDILVLEPHNAQARHNLALVEQKKGR